MKYLEYVKKVLSTENINFKAIFQRFSISNIRLLHSAFGLVTEASEFTDSLKKHIFYGKKLDRTNLLEELGDILWYVAIALDELGYTLEDVFDSNSRKLAKRYEKGFSTDSAVNRDITTERKILEEYDKE
jgi:NTP pyrophosphatase (non-canonical NTP hydrolase)